MTKTEIASMATAGVAVASMFGFPVPQEAFIALGSLVAIFMRMAIKKV